MNNSSREYCAELGEKGDTFGHPARTVSSPPAALGVAYLFSDSRIAQEAGNVHFVPMAADPSRALGSATSAKFGTCAVLLRKTGWQAGGPRIYYPSPCAHYLRLLSAHAVLALHREN